MKPLTLKMTAFGPYKHTETIDFTKLDDNTLFVISGNTGAGKTTIFDGICFALYGSASGSDRENNAMLRSDFADDDTHTAVELEFELNGRIFRILRQLGHVKKGNKSKTGERYEFYERVEEKEIPCVDRQIVSEINEKVESLIGLTQDQFKQIVMLPQGEFRKLLTSETQNKEAILRRLFKTEHFQQISERLKEKRNKIDQEYTQAKQSRDNYIQHIHATLPIRDHSKLFQVLSEEHYNMNQIITGIDEEVSYYEKEIDVNQKYYDNAYRAHDQKQEELHKAVALNDRFTELDLKEKQLNTLNEQVPIFDQKEKQLKSAERAIRIEMFEHQVHEWAKDERNKAQEFENASITLKATEQFLQKAESDFKKEEGKKAEREEMTKQLNRLHDFLPTVKKIDDENHQLAELMKKVQDTKNNLQTVQTELKEITEKVELYTKQINDINEEVSHLSDKQLKLTKMREQARVLQKYEGLRKNQIALDEDVKIKEAEWMRYKKEYDELEELWLTNQASVLASHLHEGEACPVCGSIDHPNKAMHEGEPVTRKELNRLRSKLDKANQLFQQALANQKANAVQLNEKEEELASYSIKADDAHSELESLTKSGIELAQDVKALEKRREELASLKEKMERLKVEAKRLEVKKEQLEKDYYDQKSQFDSRSAVHHEKLRHIPEDIQNLGELEKRINETRIKKENMEQAWEISQKNLQQAKENYTKAATEKVNAKNRLEEARLKQKEAVDAFDEALKRACFESIEAYQQAKMEETSRQQLENDIEQFKQQLSTLKQHVQELKEYLSDKKRVDVTVLQSELEQLKTQYESALHALNLSKDYFKEAQMLKEDIITADERVTQLEHQFAMITDLYDVLRGQNEKKVSFERYLQIEYLEQIIDAANHRLKRLSNGQFLLIRSDRQESHGRQSGLALDVYDSYTGQTRDVKTLSGGEKFNASLCLALGMSDVIQSFQGNISIDTMFIDEGFGSLDEESLNKSVDTLLDLQQSGRMIGIISHVQELKNIFSAVLEVTKTKEGYSQTRFVLK